MENCLLHLSIADDDLSKLYMALEILANNYCCVLSYLQIVPSQHYAQVFKMILHLFTTEQRLGKLFGQRQFLTAK